MSGAAAVRMAGIVKRFGRIVANASADFEVASGEIHALVGENGAGKSTLMRVLAGMYPPDAGVVEVVTDGGPLRDVTGWSTRQAIDAGVAIGNIDQILGPDNTTADLQVPGQLSNVVFVPSELGRKIGEMVVEACADANPCNVGYIWSVKAAALDQELKKAFDEATSVNPNIKVVAEGESFYTTPAGLAAAQNMLAAHPDLTVITGADQAITGAVTAVKDAGVADKVKLVGYGGGAIAFQGIAAGERYGTVMQAPATEGGLGTKMFIDAIRAGGEVQQAEREMGGDESFTAADQP